MKWVTHAAIRPHRCAVVPFIGNSNARRGFIDTGMDMRDLDHVYISDEAVEEMARMAGWVPGHVVTTFRATLGAENDRLKAEVHELRRKLEESETELEAVAVLKNSRFVQQGAPGRPKKAAA